MDSGWWVAIGGAAAGAASALVVLYNAWHKARGERQAAAINEYVAIVDLLRRQMQEQHQVIVRLRSEHVRCLVEMRDLWGYARLLYDVTGRCVTALKRLGEDVGPIPELPPRPAVEVAQEVTEVVRRDAEQNVALLENLEGKARPKPKGSP